jgi:phage FluMu gp28-like protein
MNAERKSPRDLLLPYQLRWADDNSRWKFGLMARQTGKDFCSAEEGVRDCFEHERHGGKSTWLIVAPSERQSIESLAKWKEWTEAYDMGISDIRQERDGGSETLLKSVTIVYPHGSRVIAVPGRPDTVRGYSANVLLTEFAFFENPEATWRAILPAVTNPLRGGVKKVRLITTPNGIGNKACDIWTKNYEGGAATPLAAGGGAQVIARKGNNDANQSSSLTSFASVHQWSCHFVDIHTAVKDGLPVNIEELKAAVDDPEAWAQEFECQFLDVQAVLLPYELIASCESIEATATAPVGYWDANLQYPIDMGIDFGRRHDLTVCWSNARLGDVAQTVEVLELPKMSTPEQIEHLRPRLKRARRVCLDYTGAGIGMGDYLVKEFKEWKPAEHKYGKIELLTFSNTLKVDLFSKLRMAFEKRSVRIPISRAVREDLHSINRVTTTSGGVTYRAPHSADGHADRCTALALALRAGQDDSGGFYCFITDTRINRNLAERRNRIPFA